MITFKPYKYLYTKLEDLWKLWYTITIVEIFICLPSIKTDN